MNYNKPPLSFSDQLALLKSRGLQVTNDEDAIHVLEHINYYRLNGYFSPFQSVKDMFDTGTTLADILSLYDFDRRLQNLLVEGLARIEVSCKTQIAHFIAMKYGAFGYIDSHNFDFRKPLVHMTHSNWIYKVSESVSRSRDAFKNHFFTKYSSETNLPIWMVIEIITFGQTSYLYRGMHKRDRQDVARGYFRVDQRLMSSWLHTIVYIRNLCAHHSLLWNRHLSIRPLTNYKDQNWNNIDNSKVFSVFLVLKKMMHFQNAWDEWSGRLLTLLGKFPNVDTKQMGFPDNWRDVLIDSKEAVYS